MDSPPPRPPILRTLGVYAALAALSYLRPTARPHVRTVAVPARPAGTSENSAQRTAVPVRKSAALDDAGDKVTEEAAVPPGWWALITHSASQWSTHKVSRLGAALAYYSIFSLGPLIVVAVSVAGLIFGQEAVRGEVSENLRGLLGENGAQAINGMLAAADKPRQGMFATVIGLGTLVFAAIGVVVQLKDALNTVWEAKTPPGKGLWGFVRTYVLSFAGVLAVGFLLLVSMLLTAALSAAGKYLGTFIPEVALQFIGSAVSFLVIALLFAMMFKWLPDAEVHWQDVWLGAVVTALLFEVGKFLISFYIGKQGLESTFGAAASIVIILIWIYYSAQLLLFGAELTNVRAKQRRGAESASPAR
ncbi:MAG: YihY/virulence factor BrkB family protein [Xanthobacteraceae bacterium]|nr:YihY/virulence factor BrkB family protein [Xanthobacteraceae bacterium]